MSPPCQAEATPTLGCDEGRHLLGECLEDQTSLPPYKSSSGALQYLGLYDALNKAPVAPLDEPPLLPQKVHTEQQLLAEAGGRAGSWWRTS